MENQRAHHSNGDAGYKLFFKSEADAAAESSKLFDLVGRDLIRELLFRLGVPVRDVSAAGNIDVGTHGQPKQGQWFRAGKGRISKVKARSNNADMPLDENVVFEPGGCLETGYSQACGDSHMRGRPETEVGFEAWIDKAVKFTHQESTRLLLCAPDDVTPRQW